jgi:hypothetical protein
VYNETYKNLEVTLMKMVIDMRMTIELDEDEGATNFDVVEKLKDGAIQMEVKSAIAIDEEGREEDITDSLNGEVTEALIHVLEEGEAE